MSRTLTTVTIFSSCLRICSRTRSSPWTTTVIRESWASSVSPTARLSMLKPRDENIPDTCASTPGWFCTRAESMCRIGFEDAPSPFDPIAQPTFRLIVRKTSPSAAGWPEGKLLLWLDRPRSTSLRPPRFAEVRPKRTSPAAPLGRSRGWVGRSVAEVRADDQGPSGPNGMVMPPGNPPGRPGGVGGRAVFSRIRLVRSWTMVR